MSKDKLTPIEKVIASVSLTIIFLALLSRLISCTERNVEKKKTTYVVRDEAIAVEMIIIDSCEYLYGLWGGTYLLTHKGNCKNPIHQK
jgi:hypothetical protein